MRVLEKNLLLANVKSNMIFEILILTISNVDIDFKA